MRLRECFIRAVGVAWGLLLCLLSPLAQVPGVLLETEQETILVSERGSSLVRPR